jgi:hypothetical protein
MGLMRIVTTLCPFLEAWIAYVMASSKDTNIHGFEEVRERRYGVSSCCTAFNPVTSGEIIGPA